MKAIINLIVSSDEMADSAAAIYEDRGEWPTMEEMYKIFSEQFWADKHEYCCGADVSVHIV